MATKSRRRNGHGRTKRDGQKVSGMNKSKNQNENRAEREESRSGRGAALEEKMHK